MASGSIVKRGKGYSVIIEEPRDPESGKRNQRWYSGFRTRKAAEVARTRLLREQDTGQYVEPSQLTVKGLLEQWLEAIKDTVRESTWASYNSLVTLHLVPHIGTIKMQKLTAHHLNQLYGKLATEGRRSQAPRATSGTMLREEGERTAGTALGLSAGTIRHVHVCVHAALAYAVKHNLVPKNVAEAANPPRNMRATEMSVWSAKQLAEFLRGIETHRLYPAYLLAATTGMRRGEILGLKWGNVDLEAKTIWIRETLISVGYEVRFSPPKTSRSRRSIALDEKTIRVLKQLKRRQAEERLRVGPDYHDNGWVFTDKYGNYIHPDRFSKVFEKLVKDSGLPRIRLHDLRHTWATLALQSGVHVKMVSERLGHASVSTTLDVYSHAIPELHQQAADQVAKLVFGSCG